MNTIKDRLSSLRNWMSEHKLNAFIIPSNDPHFSEYVSSHWGSRVWISGFNGSAGTVVVTDSKAALWTDSRYFLQAEKQLEGSTIELQKMGLPDTLSIENWLKANLKPGGHVGVDGKLFSVEAFGSMSDGMAPLELTATADPFDTIWKDRPGLPSKPGLVLDIKYTGESHTDKLARLRKKTGRKTIVISVLDDIAWLLNIRGADIDYNPLVVAYLVVSPVEAQLFTDRGKLPEIEGVIQNDYSAFDEYLVSMAGREVIYNPARFDKFHYDILSGSGAVLIEETCRVGHINMMKAVKNDAEIAGFRRAMETDGVALVRFTMWLEETLQKDGGVSEWDAMCRLKEFRAEGENFVGESFTTIMGYKSNGAVVHYSATAEDCSEIRRDGFLLIDSGGQYLDGTTDITRTIHLSEPTDDERSDYTAVLRGMIDLSRVVFPEGTRGTQLDILTRRYLWEEGANYLHGTGHGIGAFLCVHEGPQSIRMNENPVTLTEGMVQSNEPAVYRTGKYGVRTENLLLCRAEKSTDSGRYLSFETLTLFPIDTKAVDIDKLDKAQIEWLNSYHAEVLCRLSPLLSPKEKCWLAAKCKPLK